MDSRLLGDYFQEFDMLLLSETWFINGLEVQIDNFKLLHFNRTEIHPGAKRGSGGLAVYIKDNISDYVNLLQHYKDNIVWVKIDKELTCTDKHTALAAVYFPPNGSVHNIGKNDYFNLLEQDCAKFINLLDYQLVICGDMNARTKDLPDFCLEFEGTDHPPFYNQLGHIHSKEFPICMQKRISKDTCVNEYGKKLLDFCKATDIRIANGRMFNDKNIGEFTRSENNCDSIVDYVLCDVESYSSFIDFYVDTSKIESDHFPVCFSLTRSLTVTENFVSSEPIAKYIFNKDSLKKFCPFLKHKNVDSILSDFYNHVINLSNANDGAESWLTYFRTALSQ